MSKTLKQDPASVQVSGWQQDVINSIDKHQEVRESEQYQGVSDFSVNKALAIVVAFPRGSGHTTLANLIAAKYPSILVYDTMKHYQNLTARYPLHANTDTISKYEVYYAMTKPDVRQPSPDFMAMREKFINKKVVVVDNALSVGDDIKNFIYSVATGAVVFLGQ